MTPMLDTFFPICLVFAIELPSDLRTQIDFMDISGKFWCIFCNFRAEKDHNRELDHPTTIKSLLPNLSLNNLN